MNNKDSLVNETLHFSRQYLNASGALFYWVNTEQQEMDVLETLNFPLGFLEDYALNMRSLDPMRVSKMLANHERIGILSCEAGKHSPMDMSSYLRHLGSFGVRDTIDLMFWNEGVAFGGVSFLKGADDPHSLIGPEQLESMQRFIEASFKNHPKVKAMMFDAYLTRHCLSCRERTVIKLICEGCSNKDIAYSMSITLATVKTYVNRIFEKLGVDSRTTLMAQRLK